MSDQNNAPLDASSFEWDENKRKSNIEKHHIDFADATEIFYGLRVDLPAKHPSEIRRKATGLLDGHFVTVVYTRREGVVRIISARRARDNERRTYRALYDRGDP
ncbi:MAG: BrnT family toxin [Ancalomicrobiaceae bacterium]|nr:BrnT family toxin [Ancalomicrobiaceae bacterium]